MSNLAVDYCKNYRDIYKKERVAGVIICMSPSPGIYHSKVGRSIFRIFDRHLAGKSCEVFHDNVDVHLTQNDTFVPDLIVICNPDIIKEDGVHGAPDLVIEILSRSTGRRDRTVKKDVYGKCGVKEYWIVDVHLATVEVYLLNGDTLELDKIYELAPPEWVAEGLITEEERAQAVTKFKTSLFDDLIIDLDEVFAEINF